MSRFGMDDFMQQIRIQVDEGIYLKDPELSDIGKNILISGTAMIHDLGIEQFTFKKLASDIHTFESTIYRYFENKQKLLIYLAALYWGWQEYKVVISVSNLKDPEDRLKTAVRCLVCIAPDEKLPFGLSLPLLTKVMTAEFSKAYLNKTITKEQTSACFTGYERMHQRFTDFIKECRPEFLYPKTMASTILEGILQQKYFAECLPQFTDAVGEDQIIDFYTRMWIHPCTKNANA